MQMSDYEIRVDAVLTVPEKCTDIVDSMFEYATRRGDKSFTGARRDTTAIISSSGKTASAYLVNYRVSKVLDGQLWIANQLADQGIPFDLRVDASAETSSTVRHCRFTGDRQRVDKTIIHEDRFVDFKWVAERVQELSLGSSTALAQMEQLVKTRAEQLYVLPWTDQVVLGREFKTFQLLGRGIRSEILDTLS